jgi:hypothetical protein
LIALHLKKDPLTQKYEQWIKKYVPPHVTISIGYFVKVLDCGENEAAKEWEWIHGGQK